MKKLLLILLTASGTSGHGTGDTPTKCSLAAVELRALLVAALSLLPGAVLDVLLVHYIGGRRRHAGLLGLSRIQIRLVVFVSIWIRRDWASALLGT